MYLIGRKIANAPATQNPPTASTPISCDMNDNDCDGMVDEMIFSDPNNCGSCGNVCDLPYVAVHQCTNENCDGKMGLDIGRRGAMLVRHATWEEREAAGEP